MRYSNDWKVYVLHNIQNITRENLIHEFFLSMTKKVLLLMYI